jgi:hypothetical protein
MPGTDTIVGIVGAVLLAGTMVGVFVYEYNNVQDTGQPAGDDALRNHFKEDFPALNASGDIDQNGVPNYKDPAFNRSGEITATFRYAGVLQPAAPPSPTSPAFLEYKLHVEAGGTSVAMALHYNTTTPAPLPRSPTLDLALFGPDGQATASPNPATQATGSTAVTVTLNADGLGPGEYTVRVTQTVDGPATAFSVTAVVDYGPGHPADGHSHLA